MLEYSDTPLSLIKLLDIWPSLECLYMTQMGALVMHMTSSALCLVFSLKVAQMHVLVS